MNKYDIEQTIYYTFIIVLLVFNVTWIMSELL